MSDPRDHGIDRDGWTEIRIAMMDGSDNKTAIRCFDPLTNYLVKFKARDQEPRYVIIFDVGVYGGQDGLECGFAVREVDEETCDVKPGAPIEFFAFEDVEMIGVY